MPPAQKPKPDPTPDPIEPPSSDPVDGRPFSSDDDERRGITAEVRKVLNDPKSKARLQLAGDLPDGEEWMTEAEIEAALERPLRQHERRWVKR